MAISNRKKAVAGLGASVIALSSVVIAKWEGLVTAPYLDPVGIMTVCYGETHVEMRKYTPAECKDMLQTSLASHGAAIEPCLPKGLPIHVQAAVLSFSYNVGANAFCNSTMARKLQAGDIQGACNEFPRWNMAGGKVLPGLVKRRADEKSMCEGVKYAVNPRLSAAA